MKRGSFLLLCLGVFLLVIAQLLNSIRIDKMVETNSIRNERIRRIENQLLMTSYDPYDSEYGIYREGFQEWKKGSILHQ